MRTPSSIGRPPLKEGRPLWLKRAREPLGFIPPGPQPTSPSAFCLHHVTLASPGPLPLTSPGTAFLHAPSPPSPQPPPFSPSLPSASIDTSLPPPPPPRGLPLAVRPLPGGAASSGRREGGAGRSGGPAGGASVPGPRSAAGRPAMLITLCYLYLWARWGRGPAALVRTTVQRLRASRCSFTFCGAAAQPRGARVCLSHGGRVFCVGESQVGGRGTPRAPPGGGGPDRGAQGAGRGRGLRAGRRPEAPPGLCAAPWAVQPGAPLPAAPRPRTWGPGGPVLGAPRDAHGTRIWSLVHGVRARVVDAWALGGPG